MNYNNVNGDITLSGGESLDVLFRAVLSSVNSLSDNTRVPVITDLSDIGMSRETNTLSETCRKVQLRS